MLAVLISLAQVIGAQVQAQVHQALNQDHALVQNLDQVQGLAQAQAQAVRANLRIKANSKSNKRSNAPLIFWVENKEHR